MGRIAVTAGAIIAVLLLAQSAAAAAGDDAAAKQSDAAYQQLTAGQTDEAIAHLEAELARNPDDPALLINLGTAYFRANRIEESRDAFRRAAASEQRYSVELADGSWEDSHKVARRALEAVDRAVLAAK
jgi:cytochrome c-type biogenesis protein CcmH/NrfG